MTLISKSLEHLIEFTGSAILTITVFIIKPTHRANSGKALDAELPSPLPVESGHLTFPAHQCVQPAGELL